MNYQKTYVQNNRTIFHESSDGDCKRMDCNTVQMLYNGFNKSTVSALSQTVRSAQFDVIGLAWVGRHCPQVITKTGHFATPDHESLWSLSGLFRFHFRAITAWPCGYTQSIPTILSLTFRHSERGNNRNGDLINAQDLLHTMSTSKTAL